MATVAPEAATFNSEGARRQVAELLDAWATDHQEAASALKALAKQAVRTDAIVGWKVFGQELLAMEV